MKPMIEILKLVRAHMDVERGFTGMCWTSLRLYLIGTLKLDEMEAFKAFIQYHKPKKMWHLNEEFFFRRGDKRPRRKFLDRLIKQLEEEQNGNS